MAARSLRVVGSGPEPEKKPLKITAAARGGDHRELLVALRARIAEAVEDPETPPRDLAALSRRLLEIAKDIEAIDAGGKKDKVGAAASTPDEKFPAA